MEDFVVLFVLLGLLKLSETFVVADLSLLGAPALAGAVVEEGCLITGAGGGGGGGRVLDVDCESRGEEGTGTAVVFGDKEASSSSCLVSFPW